MVKRTDKKKVPRARENDTIEDLFEDGMIGSAGWTKHRKKKKST